jgi:hypothetical protein
LFPNHPRFYSPDSATNDATGRLTLLLGRSWGVMAGRLAFHSAAAMTARASEGGKLLQIVWTDPVTLIGPSLTEPFIEYDYQYNGDEGGTECPLPK